MNPFRPTLSVSETKIPNRIVVIAESFMFGRNEMVLPMTLDDFTERFTRWESGEMIQNSFADLSPEQREFLLSGMPLDEQDEFFSEEE